MSAETKLMETEQAVQDFLFKDKPKRSYCHNRDVKDWVDFIDKLINQQTAPLQKEAEEVKEQIMGWKLAVQELVVMRSELKNDYESLKQVSEQMAKALKLISKCSYSEDAVLNNIHEISEQAQMGYEALTTKNKE